MKKNQDHNVPMSKEDMIYSNLLYSCRISLEDTHEMEEIEECMTYVYPEYLKKKARVLAYDFGEIERYEEGEDVKPKNKYAITPLTWYVLVFLSVVFGISVAVLFTLAFFGVCK